MVPCVSQPAVLLRNCKHFDAREATERATSRRLLPVDAFTCTRGAFETQRGDIESPGQEPEYVVRADPHTPIGRVRQRLAKKQQAGSIDFHCARMLRPFSPFPFPLFPFTFSLFPFSFFLFP